MFKKMLVFLIVLVVLVNSASITFNIPDANVRIIRDALVGLYSVPTTTVDTTIDGVDTVLFVPNFTENQWSKECIRRWVIRQVRRWEQRVQVEAIVIEEDNDLIN